MAARPALGWMDNAACAGKPLKWFFAIDEVTGDEPPYPCSEARAVCQTCHVRPECLAFGVATDAVGVWGGLSTYQRRLVQRPAPSRRRCPGCGATDVVSERHHEICLACGVSWDVI